MFLVKLGQTPWQQSDPASPMRPFSPSRAQQGTLYVVGVPIGEADDLTIRALHLLRSVDVIASEDPRATQVLLAHHGVGTPITSYHHEIRDEKTAILLDRLLAGQSVALVSDAGTPAVHDPGAFLVRAAHSRGLSVVPVPGPSAVTAALSVSGMNGDEMTFLGHLPTDRRRRHRMLQRLAGARGTLILFLDVARRRTMFRDLRTYLGNRPACLCRNLGLANEQVHRTALDSLAKQIPMGAPTDLWTLVIEGAKTGRSGRRGARRYSSVSARRRMSTRK